MRNYGFDYLVEKVQVLNEMSLAGKSAAWTQVPIFYKIYQKVYKLVDEKIPPNVNTAHWIVVYIGRELMKFLNIAGEFSALKAKTTVEEIPVEDRENPRVSTRLTPEYAAFYPKKNGPKQNEFTLLTLVKKYYEKADWEQFDKIITNPENIKKAIGGGKEDGMEGLDKSGTSNVAAKMKRTKEDIYERPLEDIYRIQAQAAPLVKLINRLMRKKRSKKGEVWAIDDEKATPEVHLAKELAEELSYILPFTNKEFQDSSSDTENRGGSLFAKREMSNEKSTNPRKYFGKKFTQPEIDQLIKFLESREESGLGITEAQWTNLISKMKTSNPLISELGEYLLGVTQREKEQNIDESGEFEGYDKESLAQVLDTPEKEDIFRSHYELKQAEADRQSEIEEKRFTAGLKKYERYQQSASGSGIEAQIEKLMLKAEESDNPSEIKQIKRKIEALLKKRDEPKDEEGVMGYMTEQVNKDKHLNNIGEYKDRGFKKPVNYNHWMMLNS